MADGQDFYVRYYVGHKGKFGHEFLEFEFRPDGKVSAPALGVPIGSDLRLRTPLPPLSICL